MSMDILLRTVQHGRGPGVLAAFTIFLAISFTARPPVDVLQMLVVFLPALEVALFTLVVAVVRDENRISSARVLPSLSGRLLPLSGCGRWSR